MSAQSKLKTAGRIAISTLFWLIVQGCILFILLGVVPSDIGDVMGYRNSINYTANDLAITCMVCCVICVLIYTTVGSVILEKVTINSRRWWVTLAICYTIFLIATTIGVFVVSFCYFSLPTGLFLGVWFAPLLWLAEIEIVHLYWSGQREKYLGGGYSSDNIHINKSI